MRKWGYGINSYYRTANIYIKEAHWWIFAIEWIMDYVCYIIPSIPLLPIPMRLFDKDEIEWNEGKKWTKLNKWCGDLNDLFHASVHMKIDDYCWARIKTESIKVDYDKLKEIGKRI